MLETIIGFVLLVLFIAVCIGVIVWPFGMEETPPDSIPHDLFGDRQRMQELFERLTPEQREEFFRIPSRDALTAMLEEMHTFRAPIQPIEFEPKSAVRGRLMYRSGILFDQPRLTIYNAFAVPPHYFDHLPGHEKKSKDPGLGGQSDLSGDEPMLGGDRRKE